MIVASMLHSGLLPPSSSPEHVKFTKTPHLTYDSVCQVLSAKLYSVTAFLHKEVSNMTLLKLPRGQLWWCTPVVHTTWEVEVGIFPF